LIYKNKCGGYMKSNIIEQALKEVISEEKDEFGKAIAKALLKYKQLGYKLSNLSWFKGVGFENIE